MLGSLWYKRSSLQQIILNMLWAVMCVKGYEITANHSPGVNMKGSDFVTETHTQTLFVLPSHCCKWACYSFIIDLLFRHGSRNTNIFLVFAKASPAINGMKQSQLQMPSFISRSWFLLYKFTTEKKKHRVAENIYFCPSKHLSKQVFRMIKNAFPFILIAFPGKYWLHWAFEKIGQK